MSILEKYTVVKTLGTGAFSKVKLAKNIESNEECALKLMCRNKKLKHIRKIAENEASTLQQLDHPNIVKLKRFDDEATAHTSNGKVVSVYLLELEYASHGELFDFIDKTGKLNEKEARYYYLQLLSALEYVHSKGYSHRDVKLENLLLDGQYNLKLADFGFSCIKDLCNSKDGTCAYMAPEIFSGQEYDGKKADLFSAAIVLFNMVVGHPPFTKASKDDAMFKKLLMGDYETFWSIHQKKRNSKQLKLSEDFKDLFINQTLQDPESRLSLGEVKEHNWALESPASYEDISEMFVIRYKALLSIQNCREPNTISKQETTKCNSEPKEKNVGLKPRGLKSKGLKLKKYTEYFEAQKEDGEISNTLIRFLEEKDYQFEKIDENSNIDFCARENDFEVKIRTSIIRSPSGSGQAIECTKITGDKMPFLSVFINLNDYLLSNCASVAA